MKDPLLLKKLTKKNKKCLFCADAFLSYLALEEHMNKHTKEEPFECSKCGANYRFASSLYTHNNSVHLGIRHTCHICRKVFKAQSNLIQHRKLAHQGFKRQFGKLVATQQQKQNLVIRKRNNKAVAKATSNLNEIAKRKKKSIFHSKSSEVNGKPEVVNCEEISNPPPPKFMKSMSIKLERIDITTLMSNGKLKSVGTVENSKKNQEAMTPAPVPTPQPPRRPSMFSPSKIFSLVKGLERVTQLKKEVIPRRKTETEDVSEGAPHTNGTDVDEEKVKVNLTNGCDDFKEKDKPKLDCGGGGGAQCSEITEKMEVDIKVPDGLGGDGTPDDSIKTEKDVAMTPGSEVVSSDEDAASTSEPSASVCETVINSVPVSAENLRLKSMETSVTMEPEKIKIGHQSTTTKTPEPVTVASLVPCPPPSPDSKRELPETEPKIKTPETAPVASCSALVPAPHTMTSEPPKIIGPPPPPVPISPENNYPQICFLAPDDPRVLETAYLHPAPGPVGPGFLPPHPINMFYCDNKGNVLMPVYSVQHLRRFAFCPSPPPVEEIDPDEYIPGEESEEEVEVKTPKPKRKTPQKKKSTKKESTAKAKTPQKSESSVPSTSQQAGGGGQAFPHVCSQCGKSFKFPYILRKHNMLVHLRMKPFPCQFCSETFSRKMHLVDHLITAHSTNTTATKLTSTSSTPKNSTPKKPKSKKKL